MRERKFNIYARVIQKAFKKYFAQKQNQRQKEEACSKYQLIVHDNWESDMDQVSVIISSFHFFFSWQLICFVSTGIVFDKKERRRFSVNRSFVGDYIGMDYNPNLQSIVGKREKVAYAEVVIKYDRRFKVSSPEGNLCTW